MKIRNGFVSNSSSSSFLVAFPYIPTSAKDVQDMLFKDDTKCYLDFVDSEPASTVAELVWQSILDQDTKNIEDHSKYILYNVLFNNDFNKTFGSNYNMDMDHLIDQAIEAFMIKHNTNALYLFTYGNEVGSGLIDNLRNSNVFNRLPHLVSNNS